MDNSKLSLIEQIITEDEGYSEHIYRCTEGKLTIGIGYNLQAGMPYDEALLLMRYRVQKITAALSSILPWFTSLSDGRQAVLQSMAYQMGVDGLLSFKRTLGYVKDGEYAKAADAMLESKWATQTPARAKKMAEFMRRG